MAVFGKVIMNEMYQAMASDESKSPTAVTQSQSPQNLIVFSDVSRRPHLAIALLDETSLMRSTSPSPVNPDDQASDSGVSDAKIEESKPLTKFTLFPKLPVELRGRIFKEALPLPATFEVIATVHEKEATGTVHIATGSYGQFDPMEIRSVTLLQVCHEANEVYCVAFPHCIPIEHFDCERGLYNTDHLRIGSFDTLYLREFIKADTAIAEKHLRSQPINIDVQQLQLYLDPTLEVHHFKFILKTFSSANKIEVVANVGHFETQTQNLTELIMTKMKKNLLLAARDLLMSNPATYASLDIPTIVRKGQITKV
ncbi:uncharacterized protein PAC_11627 [Phialocephala subalpina]|uniref:2EXR domain-containing protein n=1 Tax=Phialocephala subalpina TaxID=576137 RepID=A0A1L7X9N1_9HELO|nr:uncharacterized protein PAC_11627 [Phialocephala subalpina]